jgi:hypothetical protein
MLNIVCVATVLALVRLVWHSTSQFAVDLNGLSSHWTFAVVRGVVKTFVVVVVVEKTG